MSEYEKFQSGYFDHVYSSQRTINKQARQLLEGVEFDTLVGTGLSGGLIVPGIARALDKHWLIIRKEGVPSHSHLRAEGRLGRLWVFVDDFSTTGLTMISVRNTIAELKERRKFDTRFVGSYFYERRHSFSQPLFEDAIQAAARVRAYQQEIK